MRAPCYLLFSAGGERGKGRQGTRCGGRGHACWPARPRPHPVEGVAAGTRLNPGDTNPGYNYLIRGYSHSMHFFWRGDMLHFPPPLPFRRPACARARGRHRGLACWQASPHPGVGVMVPFSGVVPFLDRYISLTLNIGYVTIKPMTKYCPVFMLSLAGVQQDRNKGLACNYAAPI